MRRSDGLIRLEEGNAGQSWVLARRYTAYTLLDASGIPQAKRKGFVAMAVQRWSPFADTSFYIDWVGSRAMVWAWSNAQILDLGGGETAAPPRRVTPESLYRGSPNIDAACLVAMDEGVEGRVWRDQAMVASQWWLVLPGLEEWNVLRRGAGLPAATSVPAPEAPFLAALPWTRQSEALNDLASRHRNTLQLVAVALAALLIAVPLAASLRLVFKSALLERVIQEQASAVGSTLKSREAAERDRAVVEELLALRPPQRQLRLLSAVVSATPPQDWRLLEWHMRDRVSVEAVLQMDKPDPVALVRGWEGSGVFRNVSVDIDRTGKEVTVKAGIVGAQGASAEAPAP